MMLFIETIALGLIGFAACAILSMILGFLRGDDENEKILYSWIASCAIFGCVIAVGYLVFKLGGLI